jgi:NADP-dependent 3-hydroxy acid dehydrogenase YdfG
MARFELKAKTVVITGASGGIGSATALAFAKRGAKLVLSARKFEPLEKLAEQLKAAGAEAFVVSADVTKADDMKMLVEKALSLTGNLDVMMLNAGAGILGEIHHLTLEQWHQQMALNFWGVLNGFYAALPQFLKQGSGQYIILNSVAGKIAMPLSSTYCASKFALTGFADSVRQELRKKNIDMIAIYPGFVATTFQANMQSPDYDLPPDLGHSIADPPEKIAEGIVKASEKRKGEVIFTWNGSFGARYLPLSFTIAENFRRGFLNTSRKVMKRKPKKGNSE